MKLSKSLFDKLTTNADDSPLSSLAPDLLNSGMSILEGVLAESKKITSQFLQQVPADQSVSGWSTKIANQWSAKLAKADDPEVSELLRKYHFGVKNQGGTIVSFHATTKNGSDLAGKDGENIGCFEVVPLLRWTSSIRRDGFTELKLVCYSNSDLPDRFELIRTNALFTKGSLRNLGCSLLMFLTGFPSAGSSE